MNATQKLRLEQAKERHDFRKQQQKVEAAIDKLEDEQGNS